MWTSGPNSSPIGLTGATAATRYVGATTGGAPTTGTFAVGDWVVDQTGMEWVCTVAGTPGTWVPVTRNMGAPNALLGWSFDPATSLTANTPTAATIYLGKIMVPYNFTITNIIVNVDTVFAANSNCQVGLYSSAGTLLSSSADISTPLQSTGPATTALAASQAITGGPTVFVWAGVHVGALASGKFTQSVSTSTNMINLGLTASTARGGTYTGHATNNLATIGNLTPASISLANRLVFLGVS